MTEKEINGTVGPDGKVLEGTGFTVRTLKRTPGKYWRRFEVTLLNVSELLYVDSVKSTQKREAELESKAVVPKRNSTLDKVDGPKKKFTVIGGYTKPPGTKPGHHGFTFVAVGESMGQG